jgi:peptidoglycan/xylan/chitin deacetylase (PgdA/CDA1 family)
MSWENIIKLHNDGHLIGCHGMNHERLSSKLTNKQLYDEIFYSKQLLEKKLNTKIKTFCWIGGERWAYSSSAHKMIKISGYKFPKDRVTRGNSNKPYIVGDNHKLKSYLPNLDLVWSPSPWVRN